jgi:uncharacterized protein (DUF3084 family)
MFVQIWRKLHRSKSVEVRIETVAREIETAAKKVSKRHRVLASRMKEIAIHRPNELMQAMQTDDRAQKIAQIDELIGKGVRLPMIETPDPDLEVLLASAAEYSWASEACHAID